tara:strand:+ start:14 stop:2413 length:2400 start_codon:yes stop_codon:yes gene_type:complete
MKVKHYNEMMAYLTRPGFNSGGSVNFNGGGSVKKKPVLPKRKPPEEVKKRQKINYEKIKQYLGKESQELIEKELGFAIGGSVETPKRGLVDESGSYGGVELDEEGKAKRRKLFFDKLPAFKKRNQKKWEKANPKLNFDDLDDANKSRIRNTGRTDLGTYNPGRQGGESTAIKALQERAEIDGWTKTWFGNNFQNYGVREEAKYLKDLKRDWKKATKTTLKNNRLAQSGELPGVTARIISAGRLNEKPFLLFNEVLGNYDLDSRRQFFEKAFYAGQIDTNPKLRKDMDNYFKIVTTNKSKQAGYSMDQIKNFYRTMTSNPDVPFLLQEGSGIKAQYKFGLLDKRFKSYAPYQAKVLEQGQKYGQNIRALEKITGRPIRKEIAAEHRALKKILDVSELPDELKYSIDHLYGVSEAVRRPKDKAFAMQVVDNLIGGTSLQNTNAGLGGYSVRRKSLINNISQGKNVTKSLARLNELTTEFYPQFKNLKQPYKIVDGQLTFAKGFRGETQAERFKSYFQQINKTPQGRKLIQDQVGGIRNLIKTVDQLPSGAQGKICNALKAGGLSQKCAEAISQDPIKTASIVEQETTKLPTNVGGKALQAARFVKNVAGPAAIAGEVAFAVPFALYDYATGADRDEIISNLTFGLGGKSQEEQLTELYGENFGLAQKAIETGERLDSLEKLQQGTRGQRIRSKGKFDIAATKFEEQISPFIKNGQFDEAAFQENRRLEQEGRAKFLEQKSQRAKQRKDTLTGLEFDLGFAGGGIAKEGGVDSGVAPESGPTPDGPSEGLASLLKNDMKIKE